jgi:KDO2-lipid IV(A) lauroyltransferase
MAIPLRKRIRRWVRSRVIVGLLRLVALIPLGPALRIGGWGGALAYHLLGKTRRLALAHLALAFPEKSEAERQAIARQMFVNLGRAAMEITSIRSYDALASPTSPSPSAAATPGSWRSSRTGASPAR